jgi:ATP-independent RNA helicase DbpA
MTHSFKNLKIKKEILDNLESLEYSNMTPIQAAALPVILSGKDVIAEAKTGSGKTAAFSLGILNNLIVENLKIFSLILCPTRELAEQVADEMRRLSRFTKNVKVLVVCGGSNEYQQLKSLEHGVHIVVGTPGRTLKFLKKGAINLSTIKFFVLDEADRMLDMGFHNDMLEINSFVPKNIQTLLFSATFPPEIEELSKDFQNFPIRIKVDQQHEQNKIRQVFIEVNSTAKKLETLNLILGHYQPESSIIFCKTKQTCSDVAAYLQKNKISALAFHGDLDQSERNIVLAKFSNKSSLILIATDVAARGLDIKDLKAVINFDLAYDPEVYTHRIGRSGRAGNTGLAISLFLPKEADKISGIEDYLNTKVEIQNADELNPNLLFNLTAPMKTIYINGGKKDKLRPGDILGSLVKEAGINASDVGDITILPNQCFVAVKSQLANEVISKLNFGKIKGKKYKIGLA